MKVATIIVNYNDEDYTTKFATNLSKYKCVDRVVIVDNKSTNASCFENLKKIENEKISVLQSEKNGGYSYGNNFGIKFLEKENIKYDYIIISNPDVIVEEKAIKECLTVLESNKDVAVIAPRMYNSKEEPIRRSSWKTRTFMLDIIHSTRLLELLFYKVLRNGEYTEKEYTENKLLEVDAISGAFFIIRYDVYNQIKEFDENTFLFYEEDMLSKKLKELKYKTCSLNTEKFIHLESQTIGKTFSYYNKMKQLYKAKMYYHKNYNNISGFEVFVFSVLNMFRKLELLVEIPVRRLLKK